MKIQLSALSLMILAASASAQEGYSAKSLFFGEDDTVISASTAPKAAQAATVATKAEPVTMKKQAIKVAQKKPATPGPIGASYFIRLKNADGSTHDVLASRKFKTGERFQLGVKVNRPTYVYILNEAPDGKLTQLYPRPGASNRVDAMGVVYLPAEGAFQFEGEPGTEQLLVYMSPKPLDTPLTERVKQARPDVISAPADTLWTAGRDACPAHTPTSTASAEVPLQLASNGSQYAAKSISFSADADPACSNVAPQGASASYASKSIAFSEDPAPAAGGQVAAYVVKTEAKIDDSLFLKLRLVHQ